MTPRERAVTVLNRCAGGDFVDEFSETLKDLWDRTKPIGKPSHSGIPFDSQGMDDLIQRLDAEFKRQPALKMDIEEEDLKPDSGKIQTVGVLLQAVSQFKPIEITPMVTLTAEAHNALVKSVTAEVMMALAKNKAPAKRAPAKKAAGKEKPRN